MTKVLLIEDERISRKGLQYFLTAEGFDVQAAADGDLALELARTFAPDVLISDWVLEGSDTARVLRDLSVQYPRLAIIILTGFSEEEVREQLAGFPVWAILSKPVPFENLRRIIQEAVAQQRGR